MMKKLWIIPIFVLFLVTFVNAEYPELVWSQTYGGVNSDEDLEIILTEDGGYALTGGTNSFGEGGSDFYLVKTDENGEEEWSQTYGGTRTDHADSLIQTEDGGYAVCGTTSSFGNGAFDFYLVKTDENGEEEWSHSGYGGGGYNHCQSILQTPDGEYSMAGKIDGNRYDFYLIQTDENGDEVWSESYHRQWSEAVNDHIMTEDGDFVMAGIANNPDGVWDIYVVKADENGDEIWSESYGGDSSDLGNGIIETRDGGYAIAGLTDSFGEGGEDAYLVKINENGEEEWSQTYGGRQDDGFYSLIQLEDGGFVLVGRTESFGEGGLDFYVVRTNEEGEEIWSQTYGGENDEWSMSVVETPEGDLILGGNTNSFGEGNYDFWLIKIRIGFDVEPPENDLGQRVEILERLVGELTQSVEQIFNTTIVNLENTIEEIINRIENLEVDNENQDDRLDLLEEDDEKFNTYLSYMPHEFKEQMLCGYMEENNLEEYTDLGFQCEILDDGHCICMPVQEQPPANPQID